MAGPHGGVARDGGGPSGSWAAADPHAPPAYDNPLYMSSSFSGRKALRIKTSSSGLAVKKQLSDDSRGSKSKQV